jgi:hypothetical protein
MAHKRMSWVLALPVSFEKRISAMKLRTLMLVLGLAWLVSQCHLPGHADSIGARLVYCDERLVRDIQRDPRDRDACGDGHINTLANRLVR